MSWGLGAALLALAALPAGLGLVNLAFFRPPPPPRGRAAGRRLSVLVPARNEEATIAAAVAAVRSSRDADFELLVMDDHSRDATAEIVGSIGARDGRVELHRAPPLAAGWCGKQHACQELSRVARGELLVFVDADVELAPDALNRIQRFVDESGADLASGFPRQITGSLLERLLLPLIHFVLLGFLPIFKMRSSKSPAYAAGCGQLMVARREAYARAGGHGAIRASRHDGIQLPRAFRRAGLRTDLFDATEVASCRMYHGAREVWDGLAKNATEGMASPVAILPWTVLLLGGQVLPALVLLAGLWAGPATMDPRLVALAGGATFLGFAFRAALALRFEQSWLGVVLHPLSVLLLVAIQWYALLRQSLGRPVAWKGRLA